MLLTLNPYLSDYRRTFAFSVFLYLLAGALWARHSLRSDFPRFNRGRTSGLPRSVLIPLCGGCSLYAGGAVYPALDEFGASSLDRSAELTPKPLTFLVQVDGPAFTCL